MSKLTKIRDIPLTNPVEDLKIPTGGYEDLSVTIADLRQYFKIPKDIYQTNDPNIKIENGQYQELVLDSHGILTVDVGIGQYVFLVVYSENYDLSYKSFDVCNQYQFKNYRRNYILVMNIDGKKMLYGCFDSDLKV